MHGMIVSRSRFRRSAFGLACFTALVPSALGEQPTRPHDHGDEASPAALADGGATVPARPIQRPPAPLEPDRGVYHGVLLNTDNRERFHAEYRKYCELAGCKPSMIGTFHAMWSKGVRVPDEAFGPRLRLLGEIPGVVPFVKFISGDWKDTSNDFLRADEILAGKHDDAFEGIARQARDFGKPFLLSLNHEMNGDWYFYSEPYTKNPTDWTAEKFVAVWRRIHGIFRQQGALKVAFAFCPAVQGRKLRGLDALHGHQAYYPGDAWVDWVGGSFYNDVNHLALDALATSYPGKPIIIAEWGTEAHRGAWYRPQPYPGDARHMEMTFQIFLKRYPNLKAMTYFQWGSHSNIERVPDQIPVYHQGMLDPRWRHGDGE